MTRKKKQLSPLISGSCCRICFLLSGGCGCHSDEWGWGTERLYHADRKHRDRGERKSNEGRRRARERVKEKGRRTTARKRSKPKWQRGEEEEWQQQWVKTETQTLWIAGWHSAWVSVCKHTLSSSDWHGNFSTAQQAFSYNTPYLLLSLSTHGLSDWLHLAVSAFRYKTWSGIGRQSSKFLKRLLRLFVSRTLHVDVCMLVIEGLFSLLKTLRANCGRQFSCCL